MANWEMDANRSAASRQFGARGKAAGANRVVRLTGVATSIALILGLGVWGYKLALRQMHGVPVIHAPEGAARVAPENPGGELAQHQGMAVNTIAAVGEATETTEQLMLAPKPVELAPEDIVSDALQASLGTALAGPDVPPNALSHGVVQPSETMAALRPLADQLAEPLPDGAVEPIDDPDLAPVEAGAVVAPDDLIASDVPGLSTSPRPQPRPVGDAVAEATALAVAAAMAPAAVTEIDPATLEPGTQLAQIGSYETEAQAKLEWDKALSRFGALMDGKARVIQAAESGGRTFYRLRVAGFETRDEAQRFCAALSSGGQCVPALAR